MQEGDQLSLMARFLEHPKRDFLLAGWGVFIIDLSTGSCIPSRLGAELGWPCQRFSFQELSIRLHPEDRLLVVPLWDALSQGSQDALEVVFRLKDLSDEWHWVQFRAVVLERNAGKVPTLVAGFDREITTEKEKLLQAENSLRFFERRFWETETLRVAGSVLAGGEMDPSAAVERFLYQSSHFLAYDAAVVWGAGEATCAWLGGVSLTPSDLLPVDSFPELFEAPVLQRRAELITNFREKCPKRFLSEGHQFNGWL
ncbi:MAG: PAS domain-containing protein, partial [Spirochaetales bacterium]|nr:PAS domain-containing protein [Spirochaetales bacterium]